MEKLGQDIKEIYTGMKIMTDKEEYVFYNYSEYGDYKDYDDEVDWNDEE